MSTFAAPARITSALLNAPCISCATLADGVSVPCSLCAVHDGVTSADWLGLSVVSGGTPWLAAAVRVDGSDVRGAVFGLLDGVSSPDGLVWPAPVKAGEGGRALSGKVNARLRGLASDALRADSTPWLAAAGRVLDLLHGGADTSALDAAKAATAAAQSDAAAAIAKADQTAALLDASRTEVEALRAEVAALKAAAPAPRLMHEALPKVERILTRSRKMAAYLVGPAGTGKSRLCEDLAARQGWDYYYSGRISDEITGLHGYLDARGERVETPFTRALARAAQGVHVLVCFDELDASVSQVALDLNGYLSGQPFDAAGLMYEASPFVHVVACGNTLGRGADLTYTGRDTLDASTLDRFEYVLVGYSRAVEELCANGDVALCDFCDAMRDAARRNGLDFLVTYRRISALADLGTEALWGSFARGISADDARGLIASTRGELAGNSWLEAFEGLVDSGALDY